MVQICTILYTSAHLHTCSIWSPIRARSAAKIQSAVVYNSFVHIIRYLWYSMCSQVQHTSTPHMVGHCWEQWLKQHQEWSTSSTWSIVCLNHLECPLLVQSITSHWCIIEQGMCVWGWGVASSQHGASILHSLCCSHEKYSTSGQGWGGVGDKYVSSGYPLALLIVLQYLDFISKYTTVSYVYLLHMHFWIGCRFVCMYL